MYSAEVRQDAKAFFEQGLTPKEVRKLLRGPSRWSIDRWYEEFLATGTIKEKRIREQKYSEEQKRIAVDYYLSHGKHQSNTVKALGYPSRAELCDWVDELAPGERKKTKSHKKANELSLEEKTKVVVDCFLAPNGKVKKTARDYGIDPVTLYNWRKEFLGEKAQEIVGEIINKKQSDDIDALNEEIDSLKAQIRRLKMEKAVWEGAAELVKKDPGVDPKNLTNKEKTILIDALRDEYKIEELLHIVGLSKSSYYYQRWALKQEDKYADLRIRIKEIFDKSKATFGSERIWAELRKGDKEHESVVVSEKVVRRIMAEEDLKVIYSKKKKSKWSSYKGEISDAPENLVNRDFHADAPNKLWLTDITEFSLPFGKAYLSPIIDCFDGMVVSWKLSEHPNGKLATDMLEDAIATLPPNHSVRCHSDRGVHYRTNAWIELCEEHGVVRSMSKKGCSPDNSACEGFFGRLKNEFFYYRDWEEIDYDTFAVLLDDYIQYYNRFRIKRSLHWMSPVEYRRFLGLAA